MTSHSSAICYLFVAAVLDGETVEGRFLWEPIVSQWTGGCVRSRDVVAMRRIIFKEKRQRRWKHRPRNISVHFGYQHFSSLRFCLNEDQEKKRFRFSLGQLHTLLLHLHFPEQVKILNDVNVPGKYCFSVFLYKLANSGSNASVGDAFGLTEAQVSRMVCFCIDFLYSRYRHLLSLRENPAREIVFEDRIERYIDAIREKSGVDLNVCGFIDGTRQPVEIPTGSLDQEIFYNGWKRCHNILYQCVVTPDGLLVDLSAGIVGRHNDRYVFKG
jgi:hypothetical protein